MSIDVVKLFETLQKYDADAVAVIGRSELKRFKSFLSISAILGVASNVSKPPISSPLEWAAVVMLSLGFVYLLVGFFTHFAAPSEKRPTEGLIAGLIAGICA